MNVAIDYSFLSFPIETLLAVLVVSSRSLLKIGWRPKVLAVGLFISIVGAYFAVALLGGALVLACQPLHALVFPMRCVLYVVYACLLAGIVRELYEVSAIEAFLYTVMGYGLQHLGFAAASAVQVFIPMPTPWDVAFRLCVLAVLYTFAGKWLAQRFHVQIEAVKQSLRWVALSVFVLVCAIVFNMVLIMQPSYVVLPWQIDIAFRILDFLCTLLGMAVLLLVSTRDRLINDIDLLRQLNEWSTRNSMTCAKVWPACALKSKTSTDLTKDCKACQPNPCISSKTRSACTTRFIKPETILSTQSLPKKVYIVPRTVSRYLPW